MVQYLSKISIELFFLIKSNNGISSFKKNPFALLEKFKLKIIDKPYDRRTSSKELSFIVSNFLSYLYNIIIVQFYIQSRGTYKLDFEWKFQLKPMVKFCGKVFVQPYESDFERVATIVI